jgi:GNAT superfamily N-acetyltransferase
MADLRSRAARPADLMLVEDLVAMMFHDLGSPDVPESWRVELRRAFALRLGQDVAAFVAVEDDADLPVAVAVGVIDHRLPSPRRPSGHIGYIEWLATDAGHRRRGAARMAAGALLDWFDERGIDTVDVHASDAAHPLYLELGFGSTAAVSMRRRTLPG